MKLTAQADFFIENYGVKNGVDFLKNLGYQNMIYTITARVLEPFLESVDDNEMKKKFGEIQDVMKQENINLLYTTLREEVYSDLYSCTPESKIKLVINAIKATAYMGCDTLVVRPICFRRSTADAWKKSKECTYEIYGAAKKVADELGVKIAFFNNTKQLCFTSGTYSYGCRAAELLELANEFDSGVVINPVYALKAGERVQELLSELGDKVLGFMIEDKNQRIESQGIPFFGAVDYYGLIDYFKENPSDMAMVMSYTPIMNRYKEFASDMNFVQTLSKAFMKVAALIAGKETDE